MITNAPYRINLHLPVHVASEQTCVLIASPLHPSPLHVLKLVLIPLPQVTEHLPHDPQGDQWEGAMREMEGNIVTASVDDLSSELRFLRKFLHT